MLPLALPTGNPMVRAIVISTTVRFSLRMLHLS